MPTIALNNRSFESQDVPDGDYTFGTGTSPISGWTLSGGEGGVYDPPSGTYASAGEVDGENVAYLYGAGTILSQQTSYQYNDNQEITFSVDVGEPDYESSMDFRVEIVAGANADGTGGTVVGTSGNQSTGDTDTLDTTTVTSPGGDTSLNGQAITFRIVKVGFNNEELHLDNAQASYTALGPDGIVDGTSGDDTMGLGYVDGAGDEITSGADIISAGEGNDTVDGADGADTIDGGAGDDSLSGGAGDDVFLASEGNDILAGGDGTNTYDATGDAQSGYTPDLQDEAITVNVGTQGVDGANDPGTYGDGTITQQNSSGSDTFSDIQLFIAGEDQDAGVVGGGGDGLLAGSPTIPDDDADHDHNDIILTDGGEIDANDVTGAPDGPDGTEEVFFAQDGGDISSFKFKFSGTGSTGDDEQDHLVFDLETFDDTFTLEIGSADGQGSEPPDQIIFTNASSRVDNPDGSVTVNYIGSDGTSNTVTVEPTDGEVLAYGDQTPINALDVINLGEAVRPADVIDIDNNAEGTFTPDDGSSAITFGPSGTTISDILTGANPVGSYQITGGDENGTIGGIEYQNFEEINFSVTCFTRGTLIKTMNGEIEIEKLKVGDQVITMDRGYQPVRWISSTTCTQAFLNEHPKLKPIEIDKDALGDGYPSQTLRVSPQHRILVRSKIAMRIFGTYEVFVPANKLLPLEGVRVVEHEANDVEYWHMMFDQHEIIWSNDAPSESLFTGPEALKSVSQEAKEELKFLFPKLFELDYRPISARLIPEKGKHVKQLVARHQKNQKSLVRLDHQL